MDAVSLVQRGADSLQYSVADGYYPYSASFGAAALFAVLYIILLVYNLWQYFFYRAWYWWPMILALILEMLGYLSRALSIKDLDKQGPYVIQLVLILVAPAVVAAACYMTFGRLLLWVTPPEFQTAKHLWVPPRRVTPVFVGFDVLSFLVQVVGGTTVSTAKTNSREDLGKHIVLIGLGLQLITFGAFMIASIRFTVVLSTRLRQHLLPTQRNWKLLLIVVNVASFAIWLRSIYRLITFALPIRNALSDHEAIFYCLDALPVILVFMVYSVVHPGMYLPYLGFRRRYMAFSLNADRGLFSKFARGTKELDAFPADVVPVTQV